MRSTRAHHGYGRLARTAGVLAIAASMCLWYTAFQARSEDLSTVEKVRQRGVLNCGVNTGLPGFSQSDGKGNWRGLDVDYCRAIAAAVLADATKVSYIPTPRLDRFDKLRSGEVDVLLRNTTWTSTRDNAQNFSFAAVNYYDGQGFMVKAARNVGSVSDLDGATVCVSAGTTSELNLSDYFTSHKMAFTTLRFTDHNETVQAYLAERCAAFSADASSLHSVLVQQAHPKEHVVLRDIISKEPLGPAVRQGDSQWFTIVRWVHFTLLNAEELGVTRANVASMLNSPDPYIRRLLGVEGDFGKDLGLKPDFAVEVIAAVGNYGEVFERNLGSGSRLKMARGLNNLWSKGGLHYAPPLR